MTRIRQLLAFILGLIMAFGPALTPIVSAHDFYISGSAQPPPPNLQGPDEPPVNPAAADPNPQANADPIDFSRGEFQLKRQDIFVPGKGGLSVDISFSYRSRGAYNGPFGYGWDMSYNRRVRRLITGGCLLLSPRRSGIPGRDEFALVNSVFVPPPGIYHSLVQNGDGTFTLKDKHGKTETYDVNGNLTRIQDRNGNAITFTYDAAGQVPVMGLSDFYMTLLPRVVMREYRLTRITDTANRTYDFAYNADGRLDAITYAGRIVRYTYNAGSVGDLLTVTTPTAAEFPQGNTTSYAYDAKHNLTGVTDPKNQNYLTNSYDVTNDRITSQTYGAGTTSITYTPTTPGTITGATVIDRRGFSTQYSFDSAGHITRVRELIPSNPITQYEYDANGECTRIVFPRNNRIEFTYSANGNLLEMRRKTRGAAKGVPAPEDVITSFTYEPNYNFLKTITDPRGNLTTLTYDYELGEANRGNLRRVTYPTIAGQTIQAVYTYDSTGQVLTATDPNNFVMKYTYDAATGFPTQVTRGFGTAEASTTQMVHDAVGNVTSITDGENHTTTFTYNNLNEHLTATAAAPFNFKTNYTYDANGNVIQIDRQATTTAPGPRPATGTTNPTDSWQSTVYAYTSLDLLASVTDDLGHTTLYAYDNNQNRISVTDAKNQATTFTYDELDRLQTITNARTPAGTINYAYDINDNLLSITDENSNQTTYQYDDFDRPSRMNYPTGENEQYAYDKASNLTSRVSPVNPAITYVYDALNRLSSKTTPQETTTYTYDVGSRLLNATDADASVTFTYDALNRVLSESTDPAGALPATTASFLYDHVGNRTRLTYPGGSFITYTYDALNRPDLIRDSGTTTLADFDFDALSRRSRRALVNGDVTTYGYDAANRLLSFNSTKAGNITYTYDNIDNRLTQTNAAGLASYTYDPLSQMTAADYPSASPFIDAAFTYDAAGNRSSVVSGTTTNYTRNNLNQYSAVGAATYTYVKGNLTNDGAKTYAYDLENQLLSITGTGLTATYTYDPFGRRLSQTVNGTTTRFLYDGLDLIQETDNAGTLQATYTFGPEVDEPLRMVRGAATSYYHQDALGSVIALSNSAGTISESYKYDAFGTAQTPSSLGNRFLFTGREFDQQTNLYYYRARYYSPSLGRFLQRDPLSYAADSNLYRYVINNPVNAIDPLGLDVIGMNIPSQGWSGPHVIGGPLLGGGSIDIPSYYPQPESTEWTPPIQAPDFSPHVISPGVNIPGEQPSNTGCDHGTGQEAPGLYDPASSGNIPTRTPRRGEPGSTVEFPTPDGGRVIRTYGPDGEAIIDIHYGHDHGAGNPHAHDWDNPQGEPAPGRAPKPGELK